MNTTHEIPNARLNELREKIAKVNKTAAKLGLEPVTMIEGETFARDHHLDLGKPADLRRKILFVQVTISGEEPVLKGYVFRASLLHTYDAEAGTIIKAVPGYKRDLPEQYRHADATCDHCGYNRKRKKTYVLEHEDGTWVQVGSTCIGDFLGGAHDPARAASYCESLADLAIACRTMGEHIDGCDPAWSLTEVLAVAACYMRHQGWMSKAAARRGGRGTISTATLVSDNLTDQQDVKRGSQDFENYHTPNDADLELARRTAEWGGSLADRIDLNDYLHNLSAIAAAGFVVFKTMGLATSMVQAYQRALDDAARAVPDTRPEGPGAHLGTVGERGTFKLKVVRTHSFTGRYGKTYVINLADAKGNEAVWFASKDPKCETGAMYEVKAMVKGHGSFHSRKQTKLTRCKFAACA